MTTLSSKADDIHSDNSSEDESGDSDSESGLGDSTSTGKSNVDKRSSSSASTASATDVRESDGSEDGLPKAKKPVKDDNKSLEHETDIKACKSHKKRIPKTQRAAMWQIVKSWKTPLLSKKKTAMRG